MFLSPLILFTFCVFLRLHCLPNACILPTSASSCYSSEIQVSKFGFHGYYASNLSSKEAAIFGSRKRTFLCCLLLTLSGDVHLNAGPSTPRWKSKTRKVYAVIAATVGCILLVVLLMTTLTITCRSRHVHGSALTVVSRTFQTHSSTSA